MLKHQLATPLEQKVCDIICSDDFKFNKRFITISEMLIRRISRRAERIRKNQMVKADFINGFNRDNYFCVI